MGFFRSQNKNNSLRGAVEICSRQVFFYKNEVFYGIKFFHDIFSAHIKDIIFPSFADNFFSKENDSPPLPLQVKWTVPINNAAGRRSLTLFHRYCSCSPPAKSLAEPRVVIVCVNIKQQTICIKIVEIGHKKKIFRKSNGNIRKLLSIY